MCEWKKKVEKDTRNKVALMPIDPRLDAIIRRTDRADESISESDCLASCTLPASPLHPPVAKRLHVLPLIPSTPRIDTKVSSSERGIPVRFGIPTCRFCRTASLDRRSAVYRLAMGQNRPSTARSAGNHGDVPEGCCIDALDHNHRQRRASARDPTRQNGIGDDAWQRRYSAFARHSV
ncbi:hypothetical protein HN011_009679 [Eciton burchellii]|nr:hypothetical protein HN011_009679 [Eciton burchellii]